MNTGRAGPALGQAQLEMITHTHKQDIVALSCLVENLLQVCPLLRPEAAADAVLVGGAAGVGLLTAGTHVLSC